MNISRDKSGLLVVSFDFKGPHVKQTENGRYIRLGPHMEQFLADESRKAEEAKRKLRK